MQKIYPFLPVLLMICISAGAQQTTSDNNFSLELPSYWKKEGKVWRMLAEKLPEYCPELSGKQVCADCPQTEYKVVWLMSEPLVMGQDSKEIDNNRINGTNGINRMTSAGRSNTGRDSIVANSNYVYERTRDYNTRWQIRTYFTFQFSLLVLDNKDSIIRRLILVDNDEVNFKATEITSSSRFETNPVIPANFVAENQRELMPQQNDQFVVVDRKLTMLK